jgi:geranylgeranyl pyrophosphate synthase
MSSQPTSLTKDWLPQKPELAPWVGQNFTDEVVRAVERSLLTPLEEFLSRPGKQFRTRLVNLSCQLARPVGSPADGKSAERIQAQCDLASQIIEAIHAGALIVDDIQDGSRVRRNGPTLHLSHGVAKALNAGNWLYFWPLHQIRNLGLSPERELELYRDCHEILVEAHFGQAIDVGTRIDEVARTKVPKLCEASLELKTGALMALAMRMGAHIGGADARTIAKIAAVGKELGVILQAYDDIGNFSASVSGSIPESKRYEDLILRRPSWIWVTASEQFDDGEYARWVHAVGCLPNDSFVKPWAEIHELVPRARKVAGSRSEKWKQSLLQEFSSKHSVECAELIQVLEQLERSYG